MVPPDGVRSKRLPTMSWESVVDDVATSPDTAGDPPLTHAPEQFAPVVSDAIAQGRYETERPPEDVAWRKGDERFMALRAAVERTDDDGESR